MPVGRSLTCAMAVAMQRHVAGQGHAATTGLVCRLATELTHRRENRCPLPPVTWGVFVGAGKDTPPPILRVGNSKILEKGFGWIGWGIWAHKWVGMAKIRV